MVSNSAAAQPEDKKFKLPVYDFLGKSEQLLYSVIGSKTLPHPPQLDNVDGGAEIVFKTPDNKVIRVNKALLAYAIQFVKSDMYKKEKRDEYRTPALMDPSTVAWPTAATTDKEKERRDRLKKESE